MTNASEILYTWEYNNYNNLNGHRKANDQNHASILVAVLLLWMEHIKLQMECMKNS